MAPAPFEIDEYVRWSDVDAAGIIFYGSYVRFFELAETELFRAAGLSYATMFDTYDMYLPRVQVHTEFEYPARLDDSLRVAAYIGRIGTSSITMHFEVYHRAARRMSAHGHLVLVAVDRTALRPKPIPKAFLEALTPFTLAPEEARAQLQAKARRE